MCAQLDLEVICKRTKKERRPFIIHEVWSVEIHNKNDLKKIKFDVRTIKSYEFHGIRNHNNLRLIYKKVI
jgi:hypothetical protein